MGSITKVSGRPFRPGRSGNPGGRPKVVREVQELARQHTPDVINALVEVCNTAVRHPSARVAAAIALLDRAYGKPAQTIAAEVPPRSIKHYTTEELEALLTKHLERAADEDTEAPSRAH